MFHALADAVIQFAMSTFDAGRCKEVLSSEILCPWDVGQPDP